MYKLQIAFIKLILVFFQKLPEKTALNAGRNLGLFWFHIIRYRRNLVFDNLKKAYRDEKNEEEIYQIARKNFIHYGINLIEFLRLPKLQPEDFSQKINILDTKSIETALKKRKGVIAILGHYGNWDMAAIAQAYAGFDCHIITKTAKNKSIDEFWQNIREEKGVHFLPKKNSIFTIFRLLKKNKIVVMIFDQHMGGNKGIKVNFFNRPASTMRGVALIAMKTGTPVVPVYIWREKGIHYYKTGPEIPLEKGASKEETIRRSTQKYNDTLEAFVRMHPEQWTWIHKRWKV